MKKVTQWITCKIKPVRVGWYDGLYENGVVLRRYWNGKRWQLGKGINGEIMFGMKKFDDSWRGLVEKS